MDNFCVRDCPEEMARREETMTCTCDPTCDECRFDINEFKAWCVRCENFLDKILDGRCLKECPHGYRDLYGSCIKFCDHLYNISTK